MAGAMRAAVFNTYRRCRSQFFYVVPPFVFAYFAMDWAEKKYVKWQQRCTAMPDTNTEAITGIIG